VTTPEVARGSPFILCISHLYRYKNIARLIEGYHGALGTLGSRKLIVVGDSTDREYTEELRTLIADLKLQDSVILAGAVRYQDLPALIDNCDFFVFPSVCENCPNTLIEVMASGKALAVSNKASMPEICGDAALYFNPDDPKAIGTAMTELARNHAHRVELECAARQRASAFPSWHEVGLQTLRELEAVCSPT
jgi:glycosyltransferase involved in cell wall biosynthesis